MHDAYDAVNVICAVFSQSLCSHYVDAHRFWPASDAMSCADRGRSPSRTSATTKSPILTVRHPAG
jgi:hypothetical protein